ncbi:MAG TPA: tetratricopeptide repeat protein, partial [Gemmatimonadaceae bacterium]
ARGALREGDSDRAVSAARMALAASDGTTDARVVLARALTCAGRHDEALTELSQALESDTLNAAIYLEMGHCAAWRGDFEQAAVRWEQYLRLAPGAIDAPRVRAAAETAAALRCLLQEHMYV